MHVPVVVCGERSAAECNIFVLRQVRVLSVLEESGRVDVRPKRCQQRRLGDVLLRTVRLAGKRECEITVQRVGGVLGDQVAEMRQAASNIAGARCPGAAACRRRHQCASEYYDWSRVFHSNWNAAEIISIRFLCTIFCFERVNCGHFRDKTRLLVLVFQHPYLRQWICHWCHCYK